MHGYPAIGREPDRTCLRDQVPHGEDQSVLADHYAVAQPLGAKKGGGIGIFRDLGAHLHNSIENAGKRHAKVFLFGLQRLGKGPVSARR